mmetsp:Transcript_5754/g.26573  ORF Transcript_5754/g.26573 Transcript_5754/m.26573 type:complete len:707 (-) Transcript_5754:50-2170(-)
MPWGSPIIGEGDRSRNLGAETARFLALSFGDTYPELVNGGRFLRSSSLRLGCFSLDLSTLGERSPIGERRDARARGLAGPVENENPRLVRDTLCAASARGDGTPRSLSVVPGRALRQSLPPSVPKFSSAAGADDRFFRGGVEERSKPPSASGLLFPANLTSTLCDTLHLLRLAGKPLYAVLMSPRRPQTASPSPLAISAADHKYLALVTPPRRSAARALFMLCMHSSLTFGRWIRPSMNAPSSRHARSLSRMPFAASAWTCAALGSRTISHPPSLPSTSSVPVTSKPRDTSHTTRPCWCEFRSTMDILPFHDCCASPLVGNPLAYAATGLPPWPSNANPYGFRSSAPFFAFFGSPSSFFGFSSASSAMVIFSAALLAASLTACLAAAPVREPGLPTLGARSAHSLSEPSGDPSAAGPTSSRSGRFLGGDTLELRASAASVFELLGLAAGLPTGLAARPERTSSARVPFAVGVPGPPPAVLPAGTPTASPPSASRMKDRIRTVAGRSPLAILAAAALTATSVSALSEPRLDDPPGVFSLDDPPGAGASPLAPLANERSRFPRGMSACLASASRASSSLSASAYSLSTPVPRRSPGWGTHCGPSSIAASSQITSPSRRSSGLLASRHRLPGRVLTQNTSRCASCSRASLDSRRESPPRASRRDILTASKSRPPPAWCLSPAQPDLTRVDPAGGSARAGFSARFGCTTR